MIKVSIIAAVAENGVIGRDDELPWHIKSDFQYFKNTTMGKPVIMGRRTFEAIGSILPGRTNIVITHDKDYFPSGVFIVHDMDSAIAQAKAAAQKENVDEVFICGGEGVYRMGLEVADLLYINEIHMKPEGNVFFPAFDRSRWKEIKRELHKALPGEDADYSITILERKR